MVKKKGLLDWLGKGISRRHSTKVYPEGSHRTVWIDRWESKNKEAFDTTSNAIQTTKYTFLTFLPRNLFEQFRRVANFYFLIIAVVQLIPGVSPVAPWASIVPLILVIAFTSVKEGWEDYSRGKADKVLNNSLTAVMKRDREEAEMAKQVQSSSSPPPQGAISGTAGKQQGSGLGATEDGMEVSDGFQIAHWKDVRVGDLVELKENDPVPADMVVLWSSEKHNIFYVETSSLDGETNLKIRQAVPDLWFSKLQTPTEWVREIEGSVECDQPNNRLYEFDGNITVHQPANLSHARFQSVSNTSEENNEKAADSSAQKDQQKYESKVSLSLNMTLWRGMILRNTKNVIGVVVYSGHDTKLMRNSREPPSKQTRVEVIVNNQIILLLLLLVGISFFCAMVGGGRLSNGNSENFATIILLWNPNIAEESLLGIITFIILFNVLIPISLYVSVEMVKLAQAWLINFDAKMYDSVSDTPAESRTSGLGEELGLIDYIFSDKTGTLTCNEMAFRHCSVGNHILGRVVHKNSMAALESAVSMGKGEKKDVEEDNRGTIEQSIMNTAATVLDKNSEPEEAVRGNVILPHVFDKDAEVRTGTGDYMSEEQKSVLKEFYIMMAICNTIIPEYPSGEQDRSNIIFKGQSPDETALAKAARQGGVTLVGRTYSQSIVETSNGERISFDILQTLHFNSTRKRMSVVCRNHKGEIKVYCKGADSTIIPLLNNESRKKATFANQAFVNGESDVEILEQHLHHFACEGLRTLVFASKTLSEGEYEDWREKYRQAEMALEKRAEKVDQVSAEMEKDLELVGCSAIEDKLQDGVKETLEKMKEANCKIWVLTGDKTETAINIGFSSGLLNHHMDVIVVNAKNIKDVHAQLEDAYKKVMPGNPKHSFQNLQDIDKSWGGYLRQRIASFCSAGKALKVSSIVMEKTPIPSALIIDGDSLNYALDDEVRSLFLDFALRCEAVVCCRVSPLQKALVVRLVKNGVNATTLSIGDGANDVSMIQEAHIGIGISGKEGMQAVMAADYSISQFRFLARLLLVHGYWSYTRLVKMICYFFYKNFTFAIVQLWFGFFNMFSGQTIYDDYYMAVFNVFFTSLPVMAMAIFEQVVPDNILLLYPQLYSLNRGGHTFNSKIFWGWLLDAVYESIILFFIPYAAYEDTLSQLSEGRQEGLWSLGTVMYTCVLITVNARIALITKHWTIFNTITVVGSVAFWFIFAVAYHSMLDFFPNVYGVIFELFASSRFWVTSIITPIVALLPAWVWIAYQELFYPTSDIVLREMYGIKGLQYVVDVRVQELREDPNCSREQDVRPSLMLGQGDEMSSALKNLGLDSYSVSSSTSQMASTSGRKKSSVYFAMGSEPRTGGAPKEATATGFAFSFELPNWENYEQNDGTVRKTSNAEIVLVEERTEPTNTNASKAVSVVPEEPQEEKQNEEKAEAEASAVGSVDVDGDDLDVEVLDG
eukprot:Nk52_evm1s212 gene=Nk52_evmTU1s212